MTEAPTLNHAPATDASAHLLVPRDIPTSVPVNLDAGIYEAAVERLVKDGSCRAEGDLNALLSQFLAYVAAKGADAGSESIDMNDEKVRGFREARKKQVVEEFMKETPQRCLLRLGEDVGIGCDGSNWNSSLWIFGLEYGGTQQVDDQEGAFADFTYYEGQEYESDFLTNDAKRAKWFDSYPYNRYLLRFCLSFFGLCSKEEANDEMSRLVDKAIKARIFAPDGPCFKGNIFPLQRPRHNFWKNLSVRWKGFNFGEIEKVLSFPDARPDRNLGNQNEYLAAMTEARRPGYEAKIRDNLQQGIPTVIVCWGANSKGYFAKAFGVSESDFKVVEADVPGKKLPEIAQINLINPDSPEKGYSSSAWIYVMPHFQGLSYIDECAYAEALREVLKDKVPPFWALPTTDVQQAQ